MNQLKKNKHSKKCRIVGSKHEHWCFDKNIYHKNKSILRFICNDPACKGTLFIDSRYMGDFVKPLFKIAKQTNVIRLRN